MCALAIVECEMTVCLRVGQVRELEKACQHYISQKALSSFPNHSTSQRALPETQKPSVCLKF